MSTQELVNNLEINECISMTEFVGLCSEDIISVRNKLHNSRGRLVSRGEHQYATTITENISGDRKGVYITLVIRRVG